jgi:hypothetical protein
MKKAAVAISGDAQVQQIKGCDEYSHREKISTISVGRRQNSAQSRLAPGRLLPWLTHDPQHSATIPFLGRSFDLLSHSLEYVAKARHLVHMTSAIKRCLERD